MREFHNPSTRQGTSRQPGSGTSRLPWILAAIALAEASASEWSLAHPPTHPLSKGFAWTTTSRGASLRGETDSAYPGFRGARWDIDLTPWRGSILELSCSLSTERLSKAPRALGGAKCMIQWDSRDFGHQWVGIPGPDGDAIGQRMSTLAFVHEDATKGQIILGIQGSSGRVQFHEAHLSVQEPKAVRPKPVAALKQKTRLRGFMSPLKFRPEDFADLERWNANVIRWQLCGWYDKDFSHTDLRRYDQWLARKMDELEDVLETARTRGIGVIVDLHSPPGGYGPDGSNRMFLEPRFQEAFIRAWDTLHARFRGKPAVAAWDLVNEPNQYSPSPIGLLDWRDLQIKVAKRIRRTDPRTPILFEVAGNTHPERFTTLRPVDLPGIVYEVHVYWPRAFVTQGMSTTWKDTIRYPGTWNGVSLDRTAMRRVLEPVRQFQDAQDARILVGEFSAIRWAPGAAIWIGDAISLFEEYGWDWTYHAFREYPGWDLEVDNLPWSRHGAPRTSPPSDRLRIVQAGLQKNKRFPTGGDWSWAKWSAGW